MNYDVYYLRAVLCKLINVVVIVVVAVVVVVVVV